MLADIRRTYNQAVPWTDELVERIRSQYITGISAARIASELKREAPGITRDAVIGKMYRLGIKSPNSNGRLFRSLNPRVRKPVERRAAPHLVIRKQKMIERQHAPAPDSKWLTLLDLDLSTMCRFPRGNPGEQDFAYCGAIVELNQPYCPHHCGIAYNTVYVPRLEYSKQKFLRSGKWA